MLKLHDKTALVYKGEKYNYSQLLQHSLYHANYFDELCSPKKIIIFADNSPQWVFAFYGAMYLNAVVIPVDTQATAKDLAYIIADAQPDMLFHSDSKAEVAKQALAQVENHHCLLVNAAQTGIYDVNYIPVKEIHIQDTERMMLLIYTSGTTGSPKGVMLSYKNLLFNIRAVTQDVPIFKSTSNTIMLLPLNHILPLMGTVIIPLVMGGTVYIAEGLNVDSILRTLNEGKINIIIGVPRLYDTIAKGIMSQINAKFITKAVYHLMRVIGSDRLSKLVFKTIQNKFGGHLQYLVSGGAALPDTTARIFKTLGFYILEGYGMTESAPMITFTRPGKRKIGYAGHPLNFMEIVTDQYGEVCIKGDNVMIGYYNRPQETAEILRDGWLHTGDIGFIDKHGLKLTGRIKDIIVTSNGKNINPEEIEAHILEYTPHIAEVGVFMYNDILQAIIIPKMTTLRELSVDNLHDFLREQVMEFNKETAPYKRIKQVHIISEELPKTRLGKIQRFKLPSIAYKQLYEETKIEETEETQSRVYHLLKTFIEEETGSSVRANQHFEIDLAMDSLSRVALNAYVENTFGILLDAVQMETLNTLQKLSEYIEQHVQSISEQELSWKDILTSRITDLKLPKVGFVYHVTTYLTKIILHLTYRYKSNGEKNIPPEPCIFVANHRSALDGIIITARMSRKDSRNTFLFAKEKHWRTRFARFMASKNNIIIMDINKNLRESLQQMSYVLQQGKNVIIFPEGTRSNDNQLKHFKETFAILSTELNIPVVPVIIEGSEKAAFKLIKIPRFLARIKVEFLQPVYPNEQQTAGSLRDRIVGIMQKRLHRNKRFNG